MSKAKFTYDESGATFFSFVLAFLALILVPATYRLWPYEYQDQNSRLQCQCNKCQWKRQYLNEFDKRKRSRKTFIRALIVLGWLVFAFIAYRCATTQNEFVNWDPFEILGVAENADSNEIKKAYRKLSLIYHPDKGTTDPSKFVELSKAYAALTDKEARKNWEQYGNPDGPTYASYGIALPSWIVEKENSFVVLGVYALIFMVALPVSVGAWWYKSMKFGNDQVLMVTTQIYYNFIQKTPNMPLKRVIMILCASVEFAKSYNPEIVERKTDNQEVPRLIREIPLTGIEKITDTPLYFSYCVKARAILHAHLGRMKLPPTTLDVDRCYIVKKCPYLLQEFVQVTSQLITLALAGRAINKPNLFTLVNAMKLGPLIVQALWDYQSPLLQLPHLTEDTLKQMDRKKIKVRTLEQLARMQETGRREVLKSFTDSQYADIRLVLGSMPIVHVDSKFEVLDDEDPNVITARSIVTAFVKLKRTTMQELFEKVQDAKKNLDEKSKQNETDQQSNDGKKVQTNNVKRRDKNGNYGNDFESTTNSEKPPSSNQDDEEDWDRKFQEKVVKKQKVFEPKPKKSHPVHCPYFPDEKQEFWWVYIFEKKRSALITAPMLVTNLKDTEEVELKFSAPKVGVYSYTIMVRSDSYIESTVSKDINFEVKPAKEYLQEYEPPQDEEEEDMDEEYSSVEDSDLLTDTDQE